MIKNLAITFLIMAALAYVRRTVINYLYPDESAESPLDSNEKVKALLTDESQGDENLTVALAKAVDQERGRGDAGDSSSVYEGEAPSQQQSGDAVIMSYRRPPQELIENLPAELKELFESDNPNPELIGEKMLQYLEALPEEDSLKRADLLRLASEPGVTSPEFLTRIGLRQAEIPSDDHGLSVDQLENLRLAARLVAANAPSLTQAATLYTQIAALHSSTEVKRELQQIFFENNGNPDSVSR